jgi:hypothetical protein
MKLHLLTASAILSTGLVLTLTSAIGADTGTARGGATDLIQSNAPTLQKHTLPAPAKSVASENCPKCRTTWSQVSVGQSKGNVTQALPVERHECGDCRTTLTTTGHGKAKQDVVVHTCQSSTGHKMAACCAN